MVNEKEKVLGAFLLLFLFALYMQWSRLETYEESKMDLQTVVAALERRRDALLQSVREAERDVHRYSMQLQELDTMVRDRRTLLTRRDHSLPTIVFVTPTAFRAEQKADLTRLAQTLATIPSLFWIVVEDAEKTSKSVYDIIRRTRLQHAHLAAKTTNQMKLKKSDPNWLKPRGVEQRNAALEYIRWNLSGLKGVLYFGDDDNTYDWQLFDEIRRVKRVGCWPVGIVGGLLVERPYILNGVVSGFNAEWRPSRPFPIDMAAFAVNLSLVHDHPAASFSYDVPRGYQESHILQSMGVQNVTELEPLAQFGTKVFVWHTRTEKSKLTKNATLQLEERNQLDELQKDALGID